MSKVSTDAKANPEPKRREMLYCKDNHICVHSSDYHFAKSLLCTMRNVEQNARICLLMGTWLETLDISHVIRCGDDHFIRCAVDHLSASFASLYALEQIAKQFIFDSITPQECLPVTVSMSPLSSRNGFPSPQMLPRGSIVSYSLFVPIFVPSSSMYFDLCQFSDFHCGHFF